MKPSERFLSSGFSGSGTDIKREPIRFRAIWISDVHLGTTGCQAKRLLEFLRATESETLYLVGDIIDGWQLKRRWYWDQAHNNVVQTVLKKARKGTEVIFVPGNHDEAIRQFIDLDFGGIKIRDELIHTTAKGKRFLVLHGDRFDGVISCAKWLAYVGDSLYTVILKFNQWFNGWRARAGLPYWSLSQYLKLKVKNAVNYISSFENALAAEAAKKGLDGVICGHIHKPEMREINGITYCNDGDWVESLTALVEDASGTLRLVSWQEIVGQKSAIASANVGELCELPS
ncbi:UDP-2,3-diacylglucosamine diphosphatase [Glaciimonas sp. Gout2]|uniref:UDP-2,3-diacylglucosamine diphosphatase n=1 Tax=unclassified Glaciimonas TaxID=2644401 RepID=UPI002AB378FF|nr:MULTISPECIES: UDP-2,3-diacylglucosamine diphosphatase [unclassified Glaciimonas]MDY7547930.1 UDP-2,3-diacylglucosamine diphosphatase [Glaciimonas sp. CA11.2]MEB0010102.1 UDP-2,3-diacylglucosamine diphosphatase [Glaciimonas sp. Cout2]MEB0081783.1 UDP-2,3-diacylglucosamine diphosphatase [Glaciimonas sp. Gout2]